QIWAPEGYARVDFAERHLTFVQPSDLLRRHGLDPRTLGPASRAMLKEELFERYLQVLQRDCDASGDQLTRELEDFIRCVQRGPRPRVTGEDGRTAVALAWQILQSINSHCWSGSAGGPTGPSELPLPCGAFFRPAARDVAA